LKMNDKRRFDEVMIVNPHDPKSDTTRGERLTRFHYAQPPEMGYYAAPDPYGYAYYGQDPYLAEEYPPAVGDPYGYYAQPRQMAPQMAPYAGPAFYGQAPYQPGYGQAEPAPVGYYAEEYPVGYYGEEYPIQGYGEEYPMGHYAEETPYGPMGQPQEPMGYVGEDYPVGYYGEEYPVQGYGEEYPMGHYAEETPYGPMGEPQEPGYYGQVPENTRRPNRAIPESAITASRTSPAMCARQNRPSTPAAPFPPTCRDLERRKTWRGILNRRP
jgi:hypothetical protein